MRPYSEDLRWRVVRAVLIGTPRDDVAARFLVSVPTIERWLRLKRETGGLAPKPVPGPVAVKTTALMAALPERLAEHADATVEEHGSWWREAAGVEVSTATMSRALTRLDWPRQTRPAGRVNATRWHGRSGGRPWRRSRPRSSSAWRRPAASWGTPHPTPGHPVVSARPRPRRPPGARTRPWSRPGASPASGRPCGST